MSYFEYFPLTPYDLTKPGATEPNIVIVKDIVRRVKLNSRVADNAFSYDLYDIQEGERPDILAHQFYNSPKFAWVLLVTNEIYDVYEDWPRTERELRNMINKKYSGSGPGPDGVHHYERPQASGDTTKKIITTETTYELITSPGTVQTFNSDAITNRQYEASENEKKRQIKILRANLLQEFVEEFKQIIGN